MGSEEEELTIIPDSIIIQGEEDVSCSQQVQDNKTLTAYMDKAGASTNNRARLYVDNRASSYVEEKDTVIEDNGESSMDTRSRSSVDHRVNISTNNKSNFVVDRPVDTRPSLMGRPSSVNSRPSFENNGPIFVESRPNSVANRPNSVANRLSSVGFKPISVDNRPNVVDNKTSSVENRPNSVDDVQSSVDNGPSSVDNRPSSVDNRPSSVDNRPSSVDNRPNSVESRPSSSLSTAASKPVIKKRVQFVEDNYLVSVYEIPARHSASSCDISQLSIDLEDVQLDSITTKPRGVPRRDRPTIRRQHSGSTTRKRQQRRAISPQKSQTQTQAQVQAYPPAPASPKGQPSKFPPAGMRLYGTAPPSNEACKKRLSGAQRTTSPVRRAATPTRQTSPSRGRIDVENSPVQQHHPYPHPAPTQHHPGSPYRHISQSQQHISFPQHHHTSSASRMSPNHFTSLRSFAAIRSSSAEHKRHLSAPSLDLSEQQQRAEHPAVAPGVARKAFAWNMANSEFPHIPTPCISPMFDSHLTSSHYSQQTSYSVIDYQ